jgi:hypothetical protein
VNEPIVGDFNLVNEAKLIDVNGDFRIENGLQYFDDCGLWKGSGHVVFAY